VAFKLRQNPFSAGALPRTPRGGGAYDAPPDPVVGWGWDTTVPHPLGTDQPSALTMRPPEFQPDSRLCNPTCHRGKRDMHEVSEEIRGNLMGVKTEARIVADYRKKDIKDSVRVSLACQNSPKFANFNLHFEKFRR